MLQVVKMSMAALAVWHQQSRQMHRLLAQAGPATGAKPTHFTEQEGPCSSMGHLSGGSRRKPHLGFPVTTASGFFELEFVGSTPTSPTSFEGHIHQPAWDSAVCLCFALVIASWHCCACCPSATEQLWSEAFNRQAAVWPASLLVWLSYLAGTALQRCSSM